MIYGYGFGGNHWLPTHRNKKIGPAFKTARGKPLMLIFAAWTIARLLFFIRHFLPQHRRNF
jgi:hypothetical protein